MNWFADIQFSFGEFLMKIGIISEISWCIETPHIVYYYF